jgi:predicted nucleic acid-binding protein
MILPDVNVLVGAFRADAPHHAELRRWLKSAVADVEDLGLTDAVLAGTIRVLTHPRVFVNPTPLDDALAQVAALLAADGVVRATPRAAALGGRRAVVPRRRRTRQPRRRRPARRCGDRARRHLGDPRPRLRAVPRVALGEPAGRDGLTRGVGRAGPRFRLGVLRPGRTPGP